MRVRTSPKNCCRILPHIDNCGGNERPVECHERREYDAERRVQASQALSPRAQKWFPESDRQRRLILICSTCYKEVTGIGVTEIPPSRRLTFELVPKPLWGNNLSHRMTRSDWGKVRAQAITGQDGVCGICGGNQQPLECHERWEYEDEKHLQTLAGFIALCRKCHAIKHFGRQELLAKKKWQHLPPGEMRQKVHEELQPLVTHYLQVNRVPRAVFNVDYGLAMQLFARRSQFTGWTTDFGE